MIQDTPAKRSWLRGFTLVELMVVIAIISLLIAILLPALGAARDSTRDLQCRSNIRDQMFQYQIYVNDYKDWLRFYAYSNPSTERLWYGGILDYEYGTVNSSHTRTLKMFMCPRESDSFGSYTQGLFSYTHYAVNLRVVGGIVPDPSLADQTMPSDRPRKATDVKTPSHALISLDNNRRNTGQGTHYARVAFRHGRYSEVSDSGNTKDYLGDGVFNAGFFDGHVDAKKRDFFYNSGTTILGNVPFYNGL